MNVHTNNTIAEISLSEIEGTPRVLDLDVAKRLGFNRPRDIRKLIERNKSEIDSLGTCATVAQVVRGNPVTEYWLNEEQALLVATLSNAPKAPAVRAMLIKVFVAYRRGHLQPATLPPEVLEYIRRTDGISRMLSHKVTEMEKEITTILSVVKPSGPFIVRRGQTAGQIWHANGFPCMKTTCWFGNRLAEMGCAIDGGGRGEMGLTRARLFDPDKAEVWLKNGGRIAVQQYIAACGGQKSLRLVGGK